MERPDGAGGGQIFKREKGDDGEVWFDPFFPGMADKVKARSYSGWNQSPNYSNTVEKGPDLNVTLAYLGVSATAGGQYVRAITVSAQDTSYEYITKPLGLQYNILNDTIAFPTYINLIKEDAAVLRSQKLPPTSATYWMVTAILYSKDFNFEIKRTEGLNGKVDTGTTDQIAALIKAGALPSGSISVDLKNNSDSSISGKLDKPFPIFVKIMPLIVEDGQVVIADKSNVPPFEESDR